MKMNVFFDKVCHIYNFFRLLLKNWSIALLPDIPPKIHHETIKGGFLFLTKNFSAHFPPSVNCACWGTGRQLLKIKPSDYMCPNCTCQSLQRWAGVSGAELHNLHNGSCGHPLLSKLSALSILRWRRIHAKILHFGSAFAFQIGVIDIFLKWPMNWMR